MITVIFLFTAACDPQCGNPDLNFVILSDRYSYVFLGILSGILSDICTDILFVYSPLRQWEKPGSNLARLTGAMPALWCTVVRSFPWEGFPWIKRQDTGRNQIEGQGNKE